MLKDKIVLITGASAGIGEACAVEFARAGSNLILTARRIDRLQKLSDYLTAEFKVKVHIAKLDVRNYKDVDNFISSLDDYWKNIDILINNAGLAKGTNELVNDTPENWDIVIDTNVKGVFNVTNLVLKGMIQRGKGHIIMIGSIAGSEPYAKGSVYCASKSAVAGITKAIRAELIDKNIRVSTVNPGLVETDFGKVRFEGDESKAKLAYKGIIPLTGKDIAEAVIFVASRPDYCNVNELVIMPSVQASTTLVYRKE